MSNENLILVDCDGVLLDWEAGFEKWMNRKGYRKIDGYDITAWGLHVHYGIPESEAKRLVIEFNESAAIAFLEPFRDITDNIYDLYAEGYDFLVITSLSKYEYSQELRKLNLELVFGTLLFNDVIFLDTAADKTEELLPYKDSGLYFIEDKPENAIIGAELGLKSVLMLHDYNRGVVDPRLKRVENWKDIKEMILKGP